MVVATKKEQCNGSSIAAVTIACSAATMEFLGTMTVAIHWPKRKKWKKKKRKIDSKKKILKRRKDIINSAQCSGLLHQHY